MTTQNNFENSTDGLGASANSEDRYEEVLKSIFAQEQQVVPTQPIRSLSRAEGNIIKRINTCLKDWYEPWRDTFLDDGREFKFVYDLMEGLLHYEYQITSSETSLSCERLAAIARAVARLVDYGNAILGLDLIIRANDDAFSETDPSSMTTIELFQAHVKAHCLREKLLYDYFKKDKPNSANAFVYGEEVVAQSSNNGPQPPPNLLQVPRRSSQSINSMLDNRSPRSPRGSTTSINSIGDSGRRTPQQISHGLPSPQDMHSSDLSQSVDLVHIMASIRSRTFSASHSSTTRLTLLPGVLSKIESLLTVPTNSTKVSQCFDLLDALLDSIERLPAESRDKEVTMISTALFKQLVRKVYVDDKENLVKFQQAHWTTCLLSLVRLMNPNFNDYLKQFNNLADLGAFITDYLFVVKRLLSSSSNRSRNSVSGKFDPPDDSYPDPTYPECWIEMTLLACFTFLNSLTSLYQILRQVFPSNHNLWLAFIECLVHFLLHESLAQGRLLLKDRQKLLADDIKRTSAEYVWISWESLSLSQKQQLLGDLMEPLLRASIALSSRHRSVLLPIFYDMMRCDYANQYITPRGSTCVSNSTLTPTQHRDGISPATNNFASSPSSGYQPHSPIVISRTSSNATDASLPYLSVEESMIEDGTVLTKFTHLIVGKLNNLILDLDLGDELFSKELCAAISGDLNPIYYNRNTSNVFGDTSQFRSMAKQTSDLIYEFMQICKDCRQANQLNYKHLYLLCLFKLVLFFRDKVDRVELYLENLYKLSQSHHVAGRYVEAGYTLLEHAKSLQWSDWPLENHNRVITNFFNISKQQLADSSNLKIFLYDTIVEYFDQGQNWEAAVPLCRELINYYEFKTYDYEKLAQQLDKMSSCFKKISDNRRSHPEYFRVTFYGKGFPSSLKDMTVVYRGRPYEKLGDFQTTILSKYPDAELLSTLSKPDSSILDNPEARYLQINACSPVVDVKSKFTVPDIKKIREPILNYYKHNECDKFQFSRRVNRSAAAAAGGGKQVAVANDDNFANIWRERTTLTTNTFPGMLPFFPVYLIETTTVSPIESAIEDLERINDRLATMVNRFKADKRQTEDVRLLGQLLQGVVDAAVNGGITKYEEAFFHGSQSGEFTSPSPSSSSAAAAAAAAQAGGRGDNGNSTSLVTPTTTTTNSAQAKLMTPQCGNGNTQTTSSPQSANKTVGHHQPNKPYDTSGTNSDDVNGCAHVTAAQVDKLKDLIAKQVPLLDEAIQLHRDRVADVMRPQHEHLETSYKRLKHHITSKYYRYLPHDYTRKLSFPYGSSTLRSHRSIARSPNRSVRSESRLLITGGQDSSSPPPPPPPPLPPNGGQSRAGRIVAKRMSDVGSSSSQRDQVLSRVEVQSEEASSPSLSSSKIPYMQLDNERRSLPFLIGIQAAPEMTAGDTITTTTTTTTPDQFNDCREQEELTTYSSMVKIAAQNSDQGEGVRHSPRPAARSLVKIRLPFAEEFRKKEASASDGGRSQYVHLIGCARNENNEEEEEEQDFGVDEMALNSFGRSQGKRTNQSDENSRQLNGDEVDLVSF